MIIHNNMENLADTVFIITLLNNLRWLFAGQPPTVTEILQQQCVRGEGCNYTQYHLFISPHCLRWPPRQLGNKQPRARPRDCL